MMVFSQGLLAGLVPATDSVMPVDPNENMAVSLALASLAFVITIIIGRPLITFLRARKIGKKIRDTEMMKVPYMLVVGEKEMSESKGSIRRRGGADLGMKSIDDFIREIGEEIRERRADQSS